MSTNIIHFIGFATRLEAEQFIPAWEQYAKKEMFRKKAPVLLQQEQTGRNKFSFLSLHSWPEKETHFSFTKSDKAGYFHEMPVQVVHIGGYQLLDESHSRVNPDTDSRLFVLAGHNENDPAFYQALPFEFHLNSYQAYYESCNYGFIFEYIAAEQELEAIFQHLKSRAGTERILYKECLIKQA